MISSQPPNVVKIENLRVHIPTADTLVRAVDGVSLHVAKGEITAIVGESGSGKTMTARSILGFFPNAAQVSGSVELCGTEITTATAAELRPLRGRDVAMVFQEPSAALNPVFPVGWQIAEGLRAHGITSKSELRERTIKILRDVGISEPESRLHDYPHQFSGGQKQRIVIAMAIALRPAVIVADEPTTALDVTVQAEILDLFRYCRNELDAAIILITHNIGIVADLADRVIVMKNGKIVETAPVHELFDQPRDEYTKQLLTAVPKLGAPAWPKEPHTPEAVSTPSLSVEDLEVSYSGKNGLTVVKKVSFDIRPREVVGLVGESGSGKSTIAKSLIGLAPITGGSVNLFGANLRTVSNSQLRALRKRIGFVFQDPVTSFNQHLTVAECIAEPIRVHRTLTEEADIQRRVQSLLNQVQLSAGYAVRYPYELSGGQRQRVGLARALALDPELIIADEPTSALDVSVQAKVLELFARLQDELGFASLFISHDLAVVEQIADRVGVLQQGSLVEIGKAEDILHRPSQAYTRDLISSVPVPDPVQQAARREQRIASLKAQRLKAQT
jgi:peptide/nickel transport system ATP-binding protein